MIDPEKWSSRKWLLTISCIALFILIPVVYSKMGIGETITLVVLGAIGSSLGFYNFANVIAKKYGVAEEEKKDGPVA